MNNPGAIFSQTASGTWKTTTAITRARPSDIKCRIKKWLCWYCENFGLSGMAIDAEYTITKPQINKASVTPTSA